MDPIDSSRAHEGVTETHEDEYERTASYAHNGAITFRPRILGESRLQGAPPVLLNVPTANTVGRQVPGIHGLGWRCPLSAANLRRDQPDVGILGRQAEAVPRRDGQEDRFGHRHTRLSDHLLLHASNSLWPATVHSGRRRPHRARPGICSTLAYRSVPPRPPLPIRTSIDLHLSSKVLRGSDVGTPTDLSCLEFPPNGRYADPSTKPRQQPPTTRQPRRRVIG